MSNNTTPAIPAIPAAAAAIDFNAFKSATQLMSSFHAIGEYGHGSDVYGFRVFFPKGYGPHRDFGSDYNIAYEIPKRKGVSKLSAYRAFFEKHLGLFLSKEDAEALAAARAARAAVDARYNGDPCDF